ncbi:MAG: radical SAM family heme chaperone HemW [Candidatus Zixiibacteriota bacterium]
MAISLYIHFPFCSNLCDYCDFYKISFKSEQENKYYLALQTELDLAVKSLKPEQRKLSTIYIGGGTPSLTNLNYLDNFINRVQKNFKLMNDLEFSFEINPESINKENLKQLKELGVNRPIFGMQSFNRPILKILNRKHKLDDSFRAVYLARSLGFNNFGIDMIFGLPRQTGRKLSEDLNQLIELAPPHISYYQLTVEEKTPLARKVEQGKIKTPDNELSSAMYRAINLELMKYNYFRYEISSWSKAGYECRHNINYWSGGDYLGLGPSAHSFIDNRRFANSPDLKLYLEKLSCNQRPLVFDDDSPQARMTEAIMLGLRTSDGINRSQFRKRFGMALGEALNGDSLHILKTAGLVEVGRTAIKLSESGFPLADEIVRRLVK